MTTLKITKAAKATIGKMITIVNVTVRPSHDTNIIEVLFKGQTGFVFANGVADLLSYQFEIKKSITSKGGTIIRRVELN
jgi:hypothetical protein